MTTHSGLPRVFASMSGNKTPADVWVKHRKNVERHLNRVATDCGFGELSHISREKMEGWMNAREDEGMGGRTRNTYRSAIVAFCNWCVEAGRLAATPLAKLYKADERSDRRRTRRALREEEVVRLLKAARLRPVAEFGRKSLPRPAAERKGRSTWAKELLTFGNLDTAYHRGRKALNERTEYLAQLELLGQQRALMYLVMVTTGLRKGEVGSLMVGQLELDAPRPYAELLAKDEKAGRGARLPLRADVVAEFRDYLAELQRQEGTKPLPLDRKLFHIPADMIRVFARDLAAASIPKKDERGRTMDMHALRHTFGTHLALAGIAPRVAMAAMRHSSLELTMNVYTDPTLLDVAGAVDSLPHFRAEDSVPLHAQHV